MTVHNDWESMITNPPDYNRVGDIFEIDNEHFKEPILARLEYDRDKQGLHFEDMYGSAFSGYINYREVTE